MIEAGTILLHDNAPDAGHSLLFRAPSRVLTTRLGDEAPGLLREAEQALADGAHVAGFLSYDLGLLFEERLARLLLPKSAFPLLWLGLYDAPLELDREAAWDWLGAHAASGPTTIGDLSLSMSREEYGAAFRTVMEYIAAGDVYQVNLTLRARFGLDGDPVALYRDLCRKQPVAHGALIATGEHHVLSLSPELFLEKASGRLTTRPMKGTIGRGRTAGEDAALAASLADDRKSRAENLMIVDLLRNDLGRVAEIGSVEVERLFEVETYRSLHQMTSTISANLVPGTSLGSVLRALFPCGSVTGAPKIRAMQIIDEIETSPRGLYCGSIGHVAPSGDFAFNVAIRTSVIGADGRGEIGIGGGIVADSGEQAEYDECLLKLAFFSEPYEPLGLIETMLWNADGFWLLERHLERLEDSAAQLGLPFDRAAALAALEARIHGKQAPQRVRLVLSEDGGIETASVPLPPAKTFRFAIADQRMESTNRLLFHKTTRRVIYDSPREEAAKALGVDEIVFLNERDELTEGSFTNLFVARGAVLLTPALMCGLLPGTLRAELLADGRAREAVLTRADLVDADAIFLGNSVRGLVEAEFVR